MLPKNSYGGEDEFIERECRKDNEETGESAVATGNGKVSWDFILRLSQVLIIPMMAIVLAAIMYVISTMSSFDKRLAVIETAAARPIVDVSLSNKIAVIEDRQNGVMRDNDRQDDQIRAVEALVIQHREKSTYDRAR